MPRLSIWHLFVWTAACAIVVAKISNATFSIPVALHIAITGGALTVTVVAIYHCCIHGLWAKTEPGHWFAFAAAWEYADMVAVTPTLVALMPTFSGYIYCIAFLGMAAIYFAGSIVGQWEWCWRIGMFPHGLHGMSAVGWRLTNEQFQNAATAIIRTEITPATGSGAVSLVMISIGLDVYRKYPRDWLHRVGVLYFVFHWYVVIRAYVVPYVFSL